MKMVFTKQEVFEIVWTHLNEKMGISAEAMGEFGFTLGQKEIGLEVEIKTERAVPAGPYRTNAKTTT